MSTDTVKAWIEERRTIHAGGRDVLLRSSYELERESGIEEGTDIDAIVDAHNSLPLALDALEQVLKLHDPKYLVESDGEWVPGYCKECYSHNWSWPCLTVQAIEESINR